MQLLASIDSKGFFAVTLTYSTVLNKFDPIKSQMTSLEKIRLLPACELTFSASISQTPAFSRPHNTVALINTVLIPEESN